MAKKGNWVAPENPIYGKGGVVESVTKFLPNVIGAVTGSGSSKKSSSKTDDRKAAARRKALAGAASGAAIADRNSIAKERIATKRNRLSQYVESKGIPVAPQNTKLLAKQVESGVKYKKMAGSK